MENEKITDEGAHHKPHSHPINGAGRAHSTPQETNFTKMVVIKIIPR